MPESLFPTPGSVKTLRAYWKDKLTVPASLGTEFLGESIRAAIILGATLLDEALQFCLMQHLVLRPDEKQFDYIFRFEGPLGTFSSRTEIAYLFGIIDEKTRSQLSDIREMRNACAHTKHEVSLARPEFKNVLKRIFKPIGFISSTRSDPISLRNDFIAEVAIIQRILQEGGSREKGIAAVQADLKARLDAEQDTSPDK